MIMISFNKICKNDVLMTLLIYIIVHKDFIIYISCYCKIYKKYKILSIIHLKLCSFNFIIYHNKNIYSILLKCIHFISNFIIFYIFNDVCFYIVINVKHIKKTNDFKKHLKNYVYKCKFMINNYKL